MKRGGGGEPARNGREALPRRADATLHGDWHERHRPQDRTAHQGDPAEPAFALAPENVRKTPPDPRADAELKASIAVLGLLENLVVRMDKPDDTGGDRYAVVAGGRRLRALQALAGDGVLDADRRVPCLVRDGDGEAGEISLAENVMRIAMHPADQVVAFTGLADAGQSVSSIATRFGLSERLVEQRLRLGNAAPELLDAYRADVIDLEVLKAFAVTTDRERQMAVWEQVSAQGYRPTAWQVKRLLTEERIPGVSAIARFVGVEAYEAAAGAVMRDLFARDDESGVWFEDPVLLEKLAMAKLQAAADELGTRWKWAIPMIEVEWRDNRPLRPHRAAARRADAGRGGRDREAGGPPGRTCQAGRRRVDPGDRRRGRGHRDPARRNRGRRRGPRRLPAPGPRHGRLHRHRRP